MWKWSSDTRAHLHSIFKHTDTDDEHTQSNGISNHFLAQIVSFSVVCIAISRFCIFWFRHDTINHTVPLWMTCCNYIHLFRSLPPGFARWANELVRWNRFRTISNFFFNVAPILSINAWSKVKGNPCLDKLHVELAFICVCCRTTVSHSNGCN